MKTFAAIDVGSFELTMKIFEFSGKSHMREIDCLKQRLDLGSDTYAHGKISNEKMDELSKILKQFANVMKSYKVEDYKAYGTSAVRETENSLILQDKLAQRTGIWVNVLSNSEQRFLHYKAIALKGEIFQKVIEEKTAIVDIGGGSIQISLFDKDTLISTQNLRLGVLRIQELLNRVNAGYSQLEVLIDEIATAQLDTYKKLYLKDKEIKNIIIVDDYISPWAVRKTTKEKRNPMIKKEEFENILGLFGKRSYSEIALSMDIEEEKVPLIFISILLTRKIVSLMGAEQIWTPGVTLCDGIAYEYAESIKGFCGEHDFERDIIASALNISKQYMVSRKRAEMLEKISTAIFDNMKKVHGLGKRERLYLQIAAILSDCGKYVSMTHVGENSYNIIMGTEMIGLSDAEREMIASIVRFHHSNITYYTQKKNIVSGLDKENYLIVAKLTAILRLANSLDKSHKQKIKGIKANLKYPELVLTIDTLEDITLEKGSFKVSIDGFKEVFGVVPVLKQKKNF